KRTEILRRLRYQPPGGPFRQFYAYTNFGLTEGAIAAAKAAGKPWEVLSENLLYWPLGMYSTSSRYADFASHRNRALNHVLIDGKWVQKYQRKPDAQSPAGGVSSSVEDLAKWMRLQLAGGLFAGKRIVDEAALDETHKEQINAGRGFYGLGWGVGHDAQGRLILSHSGEFELGASTVALIIPAEELGIVVLTNGEPVGITEGLAHTFVDNVLYGAPTQDWVPFFEEKFKEMKEAEFARSRKYDVPPVAPAPPLEDSAYLGTFANDFYGEISIVARRGGGLAIVEGPLRKRFPMKHWDGNTFIYTDPGIENATGTSGIFFTIGPDGVASKVVVEDLDDNDTGTFTRVPSS
ncbi:MAG TPA: serine hydrolase, partial [Terrimicrobiaceae bacterium]